VSEGGVVDSKGSTAGDGINNVIERQGKKAKKNQLLKHAWLATERE
jgi:hypothetical protein